MRDDAGESLTAEATASQPKQYYYLAQAIDYSHTDPATLPNPADSTATIAWGDESPIEAGVMGTRTTEFDPWVPFVAMPRSLVTVSGQHVYASASHYHIVVTITNTRGQTVAVSSLALIAAKPESSAPPGGEDDAIALSTPPLQSKDNDSASPVAVVGPVSKRPLTKTGRRHHPSGPVLAARRKLAKKQHHAAKPPKHRS